MKPISRLLLSLLLPGLLCAQTKHTPTINETVSLKTITSSKISPDGRFVAYRMRETDWKDNDFVYQVWLANVVTGNSFQLTRGKNSAGQVEWSPDGHWLAFVTERESSAIEPLSAEKKDEAGKKEEKKEKGKDAEAEGAKPEKRQIWLISPAGGEAWQLTKSETDVERFRWSKDGKWIAFTANAPEPKSGKDRKKKYSDFEVYEKDYKQSQLWLVDVEAALKDDLPKEAKQHPQENTRRAPGGA